MTFFITSCSTLKSKNPNLKMKDSKGKIPLSYIVEKDRLDLVKALVNISNDSNYIDDQKKSLLSHVIENRGS